MMLLWLCSPQWETGGNNTIFSINASKPSNQYVRYYYYYYVLYVYNNSTIYYLILYHILLLCVCYYVKLSKSIQIYNIYKYRYIINTRRRTLEYNIRIVVCCYDYNTPVGCMFDRTYTRLIKFLITLLSTASSVTTTGLRGDASTCYFETEENKRMCLYIILYITRQSSGEQRVTLYNITRICARARVEQ